MGNEISPNACQPYDERNLRHCDTIHVESTPSNLCLPIDISTSQARGVSFEAESPAPDDFGDTGFEEAPKRIPLTRCNFDQLQWIPTGWTRIDELPPGGFLYAGGSAVIIQRADATLPSSRNVLLALPDWAVDMRRARSMSRYAGEHSMIQLKGLRQHTEHEKVCLQFECPPTETLQDALRRKESLSESVGKNLCRSLLQFITKLEPTVSLCGFIDSSMVWMHPSGIVSKVLPLGFLFSKQALRSVAMIAGEREAKSGQLPPETRQLTDHDGSWDFLRFASCKATDSYAIAALVLDAILSTQIRTLSRSMPKAIGRIKAMGTLSPDAFDFFQKILFSDPEFRLCGENALSHPWLLSDSINCMEGRAV